MNNAIRLKQEPIRIELDDQPRETLLSNYEARKDFGKEEDDYKFFEKEKHLKIDTILQAEKYRQISHNYPDAMNNSFSSNHGKTLLQNFRINPKEPATTAISPAVKITQASGDAESGRRAVMEVYSKRTDKIDNLKGFMVR